jgi:DNA polymerase I-like protein with 3'-5' exonuclease and polymerase domains
MEHGIRLDRSATVQRYGTLLHAAGQAEAEAQAYLGYPINLGSDDQVAHYLYHQRGYPVQRHPRTKQPTVANDALANLAQLLGGAGDTDSGQPEGTDPILMQRLAYQDAQHLIDSYIYGLLEGVHGETDASIQRLVRARAAAKGIGVNDLVEVVYPTFNIHSQKNARWSTTDPPLAQLPEQLRGILIPQPGHLIVSWDWKGIELRILQAESHSKLLERVHNDGVDLHTWTCCEMFGWAHPPNLADPNHAPENAAWRVQYNWQGAGDKRRVFAKSARYEMNYGGVGATAARRGVQLGLNASEVQKALSRLLTADRDYFLWRSGIERQVKQSRIVRTFCGRPRRFLGIAHDGRVTPKVVREALDYPMQAAVSDIFNLTVVAISEKYDFMTLLWGMHDSQYWELPRERYAKQLMAELHDIVEREWDVKGYPIRFPADFKVTAPPGEVVPDVA